MENLTRTIYGSALQTHQYLGIPMQYPENSTLNERFGVQVGVVPTADVYPRVNYYAIGIGGHVFKQGADGIQIPEPTQHRATDAAAFKPLPFVLRDPATDLSAADRQRYALRREETIDGKLYIAYYLKRMDLTGTTVQMQNKVVADDNVVTTPFIPDSSNLNPTPAPLSNTGVNILEGRYVVATAKVALVFDRADIDELLNVAEILYGDRNYAIISEVALVSGVDKVVQASTPGQSAFNFKEVIVAQVANHMNVFYPANFANDAIEIAVDVGASEPLWKLAPAA